MTQAQSGSSTTTYLVSPHCKPNSR